MNTATARRPNSLGSFPTEKKAVSLNQDAQLQKLLKDGWEIAQEGAIEIRLTKPGGKTLAHRRRLEVARSKGQRLAQRKCRKT